MAELALEARGKIVAGLVALREELETGCDEEMWPHVELNAALLLSDVCEAIGLNHQETNVVLGHKGWQHVVQTEMTQVKLSPVASLLAKAGRLPIDTSAESR